MSLDVTEINKNTKFVKVEKRGEDRRFLYSSFTIPGKGTKESRGGFSSCQGG